MFDLSIYISWNLILCNTELWGAELVGESEAGDAGEASGMLRGRGEGEGWCRRMKDVSIFIFIYVYLYINIHSQKL